MKNIRLIAFLFWFSIAWCGALCINAQSNEFTGSIKLHVPYVEVRGSVNDKLKWNYGISLSTQKLFPKLQFTAKAGNLSASGSLSKLNSPALSSSVSAFSPASLRTSALEVSLPQYESFSSVQGYSFFADLKPDNMLKQITLGIFYKDEKELKNDCVTASARLRLVPVKKIELTFCSTAGFYPYKKKNITTWFTQEQYYREGNHICYNNQLSFMCPNFSTLFIMSTYQSPFGNFVNTWRSENLLKINQFSFTLNGFYNPNEEVITSSDKKLKPLLQTSLGGQYSFLTQTKIPVKITTGINTLLELNLSEQNHILKSCFGIRYSSNNFNGLFEINSSFKLVEEQEGINATFTSGAIENSNTFYINDFTTSLSQKFTFTPDAKKTKWTFSQKLGLQMEYEMPRGIMSFSNNNQITFTQKTDDSKNKIAFTSTLTAKFQFRFCTLRVHLEFQV